MAYVLVGDLRGPGGPVAVKPDKVVMVITTGAGCEIKLEGGVSIPLLDNARDTAQKLWGELNGMPNGYFNSDHLVSITPHPDGGRFTFTDNATLDIPMPVSMLIESVSTIDETRKNLDLNGSTIGRV